MWLRAGKFCAAVHAADSLGWADSETGRGRHNLEKNDVAPADGHDINWLEATKSEMAGNVRSSRPQASVHTHCSTWAYAK